MNRLTAAGLALLLAGAASPALAKPNFDTNADGRVSLEEMHAERLQKVMHMDTNRDGQVSRAEFEARRDARAERRERKGKAGDAAGKPRKAKDMFARLDRDRNGFITKAEVRRMSERRFAKLDRAGTGYIPAEQLTQRRDR